VYALCWRGQRTASPSKAKAREGGDYGETEADVLCVARRWKVPFLFLVRGCEHGLALAAAASISWVRSQVRDTCLPPSLAPYNYTSPSIALFEQSRAEQSV